MHVYNWKVIISKEYKRVNKKNKKKSVSFFFFFVVFLKKSLTAWVL